MIFSFLVIVIVYNIYADRPVSHSDGERTEDKEVSEWRLTNEEKKTLLELARMKLEEICGNRKMDLDVLRLTSTLKEEKACFVSLYKNGNLRGCVGYLYPQGQLYKIVMDNVVNAALKDSRFSPVMKEELKDIKIEITALSSIPQRLCFSSGEDLKSKLKPRIDGVILKRGFRQSTYIPQVWNSFTDKEEFLSSLCMKGGMRPNSWKDTSTEVYTYEGIYFSEE